MNRKADTSSSSGAMIAALLALAVLSLVVIFVVPTFYKFITGAEQLPVWLTGKTEEVKGIELVRCDLSNSNLQYYTGNKWKDMKSEVVLNGKIIDSNVLKNNFEGYWYQDRLEDFSFNFNDNQREIIASNIPDDSSNNAIRTYFNSKGLRAVAPYLISPFEKYVFSPEQKDNRKNSFVVLRIDNPGLSKDVDSYKPGSFVVDLDNNILFEFWTPNPQNVIKKFFSFLANILSNQEKSYLHSVKLVNKDSSSFADLMAKINQWKDSVLEKPILIGYSEKNSLDNNKVATVQRSEEFCVKKYDNIYLVVDLSKPERECGKDEEK